MLRIQKANDERCQRVNLPQFRYHPDPLAAGMIQPSEAECVCCGEARGYVYTGPVFAVEDYEDCNCPWCIADGSASKRLDATFADDDGVGGGRQWDEVSEDVVDEITKRTPGFTGWQQEQWWTHCDAAEFHGWAGHEQAISLGEDFLDAIRANTGIESDETWNEFLEALSTEHGPTAYAFRCRNCGKLGGYTDTD